ncbi:aldo/keto reductase [Nonomuraea sp. NPDC050394]|uniref:aldo/keto reductase n=1 Tax=Nonomuraea sp. NPDC050394 TaxID=3364363 RepID=UPI0037AB78F0
MDKNRVEHDLLGEIRLSSNDLFGIHTARASENFRLGGESLRQLPALLTALAQVKSARHGPTSSSACCPEAGLREGRDRVERYERLCDEIGEHPAAVGLAWLLHQPGVTAPIAGARSSSWRSRR